MFTGINSGVNGGFAPYLVAHRGQIFKTPQGVSAQAAVMTEPLAVALQAVLDNRPCPGENALIIGGGVIGALLIQVIKALEKDCRVAVIDPSSFAAELAMELGADQTIPVKEIFDSSSKITGAKVYKPLLGMEISMGGYDRIYDTVAASSTLNMSLRLLKAMGTLSVIGIGGEVKLDLTPLWLKLQNIKGVYSYGEVDFQGERRHAFEVALEMMRDGRIQAEGLVTHKFKLEDYRRMIEVNKNKEKHRAIKTVISFTE
jgi:threonine dehydrogenase-like Zn-dependent dehydrogenase